MGEESRNEYLKRVRNGYPAKITNTRRCWTQADYNDLFELLTVRSTSKSSINPILETANELEITEDEVRLRLTRAAGVGFEYIPWSEEEDVFLKNSYCEHTYLNPKLKKQPMGWIIDTSVAFPHRSKEAVKRRQKQIMAKPKPKEKKDQNTFTETAF